MSCISLTVVPVAPTILNITPVDGARMDIGPVDGASLRVTPVDNSAVLSVTPLDNRASLSITPEEACVLTIGEVCSVSGGTIVVLAASDGPLRTRDGGYLLLDPATNPPEN